MRVSFGRSLALLIGLVGASGPREALAEDVPANVTPAPAPAAATATAKGETPVDPPKLHLTVDGEPGLLLERRQNVSEGWNLTFPPGYQHIESWEVACVAPCDTVVDPASIYRINGSGVATSYDFTLPQGRAALRMHLVPRWEVVHGGGVVLTIVGALVTLLGASSLVSAPVVSDAAASSDLRVGGWIGVGVGAAMMAVGIPLWITNHSFARTDDCRTLGSAGGGGWAF